MNAGSQLAGLVLRIERERRAYHYGLTLTPEEWQQLLELAQAERKRRLAAQQRNAINQTKARAIALPAEN